MSGREVLKLYRELEAKAVDIQAGLQEFLAKHLPGQAPEVQTRVHRRRVDVILALPQHLVRVAVYRRTGWHLVLNGAEVKANLKSVKERLLALAAGKLEGGDHGG